MNEKMLLLQNSILRDIAAIDEIYAELAEFQIEPDTDYRDLIIIAYHLHHLYNAFENIFKNVAVGFENSVSDTDKWHAQLLDRMALDLLPLRPRLVDDAMYDALDELRRFRHLFRHAYRTRLDGERLTLVLRKAHQLHGLYKLQIDQFLEFIKALS